jgi:predicted MFS family arabinose efflux permease
MNLQTVGLIVSISRLSDTLGRYVGGRLCDRIKPARVILLGVVVGVPMFSLQVYGSGFATLMLPLAIMTMGFGFTNVGATTFALQSADRGVKELSLGISRASTSVGQAIGPLVCGALIERMGYEGGFHTMALISAVVLALTWVGLRQQTGENAE